MIGRLIDAQEISNPIQVNNDEFIVCTKITSKMTSNKQNDSDVNTDVNTDVNSGVWSYNINDKCWKHLCKYDKNVVKNVDTTPQIAYMYTCVTGGEKVLMICFLE